MSDRSITLRYLRGSLVLLGLGLVAGIGAAVVTYQRQMAAEQAQRIAQGQRSEIRNRLARASQEEAELRTKIALYENLVAKGVIGNERRLDWIEQMSRIRTERRLPDLKYELSPQHAVERTLLPSGAQSGGVTFMTSTVKVSSGLLHEGDLVALMADLRDHIPAFVTLRSCKLARTPASTASDANSQPLKAECEFEWVTIKGAIQ